jgi:hypothetical protein
MAKNLLSPRADNILASLQYQGSSNDCGPYTTATVINALRGLNIDALALADEMDRPVWRGPMFVVRRVPNWATFPWGMVDVFRSYGLKANWRFFTSQDHITKVISQGDVAMPIIGSWRPLWAHVMTLVAWDDEKGWGFANTQFSHHNITWLSDEKFQKQWRALGRLNIEVLNA